MLHFSNISKPNEILNFMQITEFILNFPELTEKNKRYYLYLGLVAGLSAKEVLLVISYVLEQEVLKRKILLDNIMFSTGKWTRADNNEIFKKVYNSKNILSSYYKKESASIILMFLFPRVSRKHQNLLMKDFSQSRYKNNRKRIYKYFYKTWTPHYEFIVENAWINFKDEDAISLVINKMPREFLLRYFNELMYYFEEESLAYDFYLRKLRNRLYIRLNNDIPSEIEKLKIIDPISYIFIKKECKEKLDTSWAIKIYKKFSNSRFLARWYSEMGLWQDILQIKPDLPLEMTS